MADLRQSALRAFYSLQPFDLTGDVQMSKHISCNISCIIPTFDRLNDLDILLNCLSGQDLPAEHFEVIVVDDGTSVVVAACCLKYKSQLNIRYISSGIHCHSVGALRNLALCECSGNYILFLDDDTRILQRDFLTELVSRFEMLPTIDCIQISGSADRSLVMNRYSYLDRYSFATRCVAYRRSVITRLGGFIDSLKSYEDIELSIRFMLAGGSYYQDEELHYYHPPLCLQRWNKVITNGMSFLTLRNRYSLIMWIVCYLNALRFLPFLLSPVFRHRQWGKISAGFLAAPLYQLFRSKEIYYR